MICFFKKKAMRASQGVTSRRRSSVELGRPYHVRYRSLSPYLYVIPIRALRYQSGVVRSMRTRLRPWGALPGRALVRIENNNSHLCFFLVY